MASEASHDELWQAVVPDQRYEAARRGDVDDLAYEDQCFNCAFFHVLEGRRGMDWGVCFNPASPRHGQVNFEHYGCDQWAPDQLHHDVEILPDGSLPKPAQVYEPGPHCLPRQSPAEAE